MNSRKLISVLAVPFISGFANTEYEISGNISGKGFVTSPVSIGRVVKGNISGKGLISSFEHEDFIILGKISGKGEVMSSVVIFANQSNGKIIMDDGVIKANKITD